MAALVNLGLIAVGGAIGAVLRFAVAGWTHRLAGPAFPYGTLAVNLLGCLAIGLLWAVSERSTFDPRLAAFLFVGVLGSFTTFSTYSLELVNLLRNGHVVSALAYFMISNVVGVVAAAVGYAAARTLG